VARPSIGCIQEDRPFTIRVMANDTVEELEIVDVPEQRRYEVRVRSRVVGHTRYALQGGSIALLHTEIDPSMEGKGVGSRLAAAALAESTSRGLSVVVRCPFIAAYVRRHLQDYPDVELRD
jgi:predicted GNAT family acetyltransferase